MRNSKVLIEAKEIIDDVKLRYDYFYRKYARLCGDVMDGGFYKEIETKSMTNEEYNEFKELIKEVDWLDDNLNLEIKGYRVYIVDNR